MNKASPVRSIGQFAEMSARWLMLSQRVVFYSHPSPLSRWRTRDIQSAKSAELPARKERGVRKRRRMIEAIVYIGLLFGMVVIIALDLAAIIGCALALMMGFLERMQRGMWYRQRRG